MQALKVLVTFLTILIVVAMTVIAYGMYRKSIDPNFKFFEFGGKSVSPDAIRMPTLSSTTGSTRTREPTPRAFGEIMLSLPTGCNISTVSGDGYRIFLKVGPTEPKCERVIVIDARSGALLGTLRASP
jgi:hypothetical protein